jgi:hypothetical protein
MKSHKYWSLGALFCMLGCIYSGIRKSMTAHKYFAYSSLLCMGMSIYSGHKLVSPKKKKITESKLNKKLTFIHQKRSCWRVFFSSSTFFIFKPLKHNTVQSASSNYYIYSFHTPFGKFHFPSVHRTSYHNQMPRQHHSHGFPLLSDLCALSV